jgi:hypothetical protein
VFYTTEEQKHHYQWHDKDTHYFKLKIPEERQDNVKVA